MSIGLLAFVCFISFLLILMIYGQFVLSEMQEKRMKEDYEEEVVRLRDALKGDLERLQKEEALNRDSD